MCDIYIYIYIYIYIGIYIYIRENYTYVKLYVVIKASTNLSSGDVSMAPPRTSSYSSSSCRLRSAIRETPLCR